MKRIMSFFIVAGCIFLAGCSFSLGSKASFPSELNPVYFFSENAYSPLSSQITALFRSMDVKLVKKKSDAHFSILVVNSGFTHSNPDIVNISLPTNVIYTGFATLEIVDNYNKSIVISKTFSVSQTLSLAANQINTNSQGSSIQQQLILEMTSLIYYWLISIDTKAALHNAIIHKTIIHAP